MVADKWGKRTVVTFTLVLYGLASILSGIAPKLWPIVVLPIFKRTFKERYGYSPISYNQRYSSV